MKTFFGSETRGFSTCESEVGVGLRKDHEKALLSMFFNVFNWPIGGYWIYGISFRINSGLEDGAAFPEESWEGDGIRKDADVHVPLEHFAMISDMDSECLMLESEFLISDLDPVVFRTKISDFRIRNSDFRIKISDF